MLREKKKVWSLYGTVWYRAPSWNLELVSSSPGDDFPCAPGRSPYRKKLETDEELSFREVRAVDREWE